MHRRVLVVALALTLVVVLAVGAWFGLRATQRSAFEQAAALLPEPTLRATWTDWSQVRDLADGDDLGSDASTRDVGSFLSRAYDLDLTSTSAVVDSTYALNRRYGFSPLDASWEMYGQSREGAVVVMRFDDSVDLAGVERNLRRLGYDAPDDGAGAEGVWAGSADLVAAIDPSLTPVMQNVVVLPDEGVVMLADATGYAERAASVVAGEETSLDEVAGVSDLASLVEEPVSAVLFASDFACEALSMGDTDEDDQALADQLVRDAGGVSPLAGLVLALEADRSMLVGMHFETSDQASADLEPRVDLATGEAVGQGGTFGDRFEVAEARSEGNQVVMDLRPAEEDSPLLSDLSQGPVLFATC